MVETKSFSADPDKLLMLPTVRGIIETGTLGKEEGPNHPRKDGIVAFLPITKKVNFKGKPKEVEVLLGKDKAGNLYYDLFLDNSRKKESPDSGVKQNSRLPGDSSPASGVGQNLRLARDSMTGYPAFDVNISIADPRVKPLSPAERALLAGKIKELIAECKKRRL